MAVLVFGSRGRIGLCAVDALQRLGHEVIESDPSLREIRYDDLDWHKVKLVFSCAPFYANYGHAKEARLRGLPYIDLGGDTFTSQQIQELFVGANQGCFTDWGLAPGFVNIWAEHELDKLNYTPNTIKLMCGGLSQNRPNNRLAYERTWSTSGLWNEYSGDCEILSNGKLTTIPALTRDLNVVWKDPKCPWLTKILERFHTKGGIGSSLESFKTRGIKNASYQTLRYMGHIDYISFLLDDCKLSREEFIKAIDNVCPVTLEDAVVTMLEIDGKLIQKTYFSDEKWTAMQKMTAWPTVAVCQLLLEGKLPKKPVLSYEDVPEEEFNQILNKLSI